jgi:hypothetical protein
MFHQIINTPEDLTEAMFFAHTNDGVYTYHATHKDFMRFQYALSRAFSCKEAKEPFHYEDETIDARWACYTTAENHVVCVIQKKTALVTEESVQWCKRCDVKPAVAYDDLCEECLQNVLDQLAAQWEADADIQWATGKYNI